MRKIIRPPKGTILIPKSDKAYMYSEGFEYTVTAKDVKLNGEVGANFILKPNQ